MLAPPLRHVVQLRPYQYHNRISTMSSSETPSRSKPALFNANLFSTPSSTSSSGLSSLGFGEDIFSGKYYINYTNNYCLSIDINSRTHYSIVVSFIIQINYLS